jgi:hypothetical protein
LSAITHQLSRQRACKQKITTTKLISLKISPLLRLIFNFLYFYSESQEVSQKILEFQKRLDEARTLVKAIPGKNRLIFDFVISLESFFRISLIKVYPIVFLGIDQSKSQQLEHLESLKKQLVSKQELINKYKQYNF